MGQAPGGRTDNGRGKGEQTVDPSASSIGLVVQTTRLAWKCGPGEEGGRA